MPTGGSNSCSSHSLSSSARLHASPSVCRLSAAALLITRKAAAMCVLVGGARFLATKVVLDSAIMGSVYVIGAQPIDGIVVAWVAAGARKRRRSQGWPDQQHSLWGSDAWEMMARANPGSGCSSSRREYRLEPRAVWCAAARAHSNKHNSAARHYGCTGKAQGASPVCAACCAALCVVLCCLQPSLDSSQWHWRALAWMASCTK